MTTAYHSKYWANALTLQASSDTFDKLTRSIANARVDLNPHQVDAALFAFRSPLSHGVLLADEVGLGKTIEAGIVIAQKWAERRRKILLIVPATLRKQWQLELEEKFFLPTMILEAASYNQLRKERANPFDLQNKVIICSYQFSAVKADDIRRVGWDLTVIDEAHRLRNVYKASNKIGNTLKSTLMHVPKMLLTATPLQNSLMELYGLVSIIDPHVFGDEKTFREQFVKGSDEESRNKFLKERLKSICTRTLRKQVLEYVPYTQRIPITQDFLPSDDEHRLYEKVSSYLQREVLVALPASQRKLMTLVLRKLLASSTFAIAGTLRGLIQRLEGMEQDATQDFKEDFSAFDEVNEEWDEDDKVADNVDPQLLKEELRMLREYAQLAEGIQYNAKGEALLLVLDKAFEKAKELGASEKAVIFTESRRTQQYLFDLLTANGYSGKIVLFNGSNSDPLSKEIYEKWLERHAGQPVVSGSRSADMRAALIEEFRERATLMIATESAAEGVNLQFSSLVVNYDLPWNPQRIEQRIGRCHRYGQAHDVVVVNFLNRRNEADQRVFQLLSEKFHLFNGVFGSSDEVLGVLESGVDLEKRIASVYQECRTQAEIVAAFDTLQAELESKITGRLTETRKTLLDNFDEDVHARLKLHEDNANVKLSEHEQHLLSLVKTELSDLAKFEDHQPKFYYSGSDFSNGIYNLDWREAEKNSEEFFRVDHPLATSLIEKARNRSLPVAHLQFDYSGYHSIISPIQSIRGQSGWLQVSKLMVDSLELEEFLLLSAQTDTGIVLDEDTCQKLLKLSTSVMEEKITEKTPESLNSVQETLVQERLRFVEAHNARYFDEEVAKLERWSDDLKMGLEREIHEIDKQLKEIRRKSTTAVSLQEKLAAQKELKGIEEKRKKKRRDLYAAQDEIDARRDELITSIERQLKQEQNLETLFTVRWTVV